MKSNLIRLARLTATLVACAPTLHAAVITVSAPDSPMLRFALGKLEAAFQQQGDSLKRSADPAPGIAVALDPAAKATVGGEGYQRTKAGRGLKVTASDERGAMYGVLDLADDRFGVYEGTLDLIIGVKGNLTDVELFFIEPLKFGGLLTTEPGAKVPPEPPDPLAPLTPEEKK